MGVCIRTCVRRGDVESDMMVAVCHVLYVVSKVRSHKAVGMYMYCMYHYSEIPITRGVGPRAGTGGDDGENVVMGGEVRAVIMVVYPCVGTI